MEIALLATMIALGYAFVNFAKFVTAADWAPARTQAFAWAAGVGIVFLGSATNWGSTVDIGGVSLDDINAASKVFLGFCILSPASVVNDLRNAIDNNSSAKMPTLFGGKQPA